MTLKEIAKAIEEFSNKRGWENNDPCQLLVALNAEMGELSEHFLWKNKWPNNLSESEQKEIAFEIVDVLIYLLQVSNKIGITDLTEFYKEKVKKLEIKYPENMDPKDWRKKHNEYKQSGKNKLYN